MSIETKHTPGRGAEAMSEIQEQCPQCKSNDDVRPYVSEAGINMFACGRCFIQWRAAASHVPQAPTPELELERETDGRWIAEFTRFPGVMAYGTTEQEAIANAAKVLVESQAPSPAQGEGQPTLRSAIFEMMAHRQWSTHWIHRSAYLHLESAELAEAVRGKRGDTLDESADVLITLLALSPHELRDIEVAAAAKVKGLMTKPRYTGETGTFGDVAEAARSGREPEPTPDFSIDKDQQCRMRVITDTQGGWLKCQKAKGHSGKCDPNGYEPKAALEKKEGR